MHTEIASFPSLAKARARRPIESDRFSVSEIVPELAAPTLLHTIFEERAREAPDRVAVTCGEQSVSYAELDRRAERIAEALRARGVGPGAFVAFQLPRSIDVYAVLLGVLKSGAAYVPLDPEFPPDRVEAILRNCDAAALITPSSLGGVDVTFRATEHAAERATERRAPTPGDIAYVIYTSGSTGAPKGVAIEHASVAHLVRAEQRLFEITPADRVMQGFSIAFDAAVEEIWLAFAAGATLIVAPKQAMVEDLARFTRDARITVLSTVPTLLATAEGEFPTVRLLIVGGEACPQSVADRFAVGRAMYNTYGPTEATVIATCGRLSPGQKVTIGRPIPNYRVYVVGDDGRPAPPGTAGEIWIGGPGVARGYVGSTELTAARFVRDPRGLGGLVYRTGDRGRFDARGDLEFLGRIDDQVKLRGYRIELGEIEAALVAAGAAQAVALVRGEELVGYVVARDGEPLAARALQDALRSTLPPYMIPAHIEVLDAMPTLTSGKVDKRKLPAPRRQPPAGDAPIGELEAEIAAAFREALGAEHVGRESDFFVDLGGHSLIVARVVSRLRRAPAFAKISVLDVYERPTVAGLAGRFAKDAQPPRDVRAARPVSRVSYALCTAGQLAALFGIVAVHAAQWLGPYLAYFVARHADVSLGAAVATAAAALVAAQPMALALAIVTKWLVIGRYEPGRYPLWGAYFFRFWLVERVLAVAPTDALVGTPLLPIYLRLLGARVGSSVHLATDSIRCFDLVSIGDDVSVGADARLRGYAVENGELVIGRIAIGDRCVVGARSVVSDDVAIGDAAVIGDLSLVPRGARVGARERWVGSPARRDGTIDDWTPVDRPSAARRAFNLVAYGLGALATPALALVALLPGFALLGALETRVGGYYVLAAPAAAVLFVVLLCLEVAALKWLVLGRARAGAYPLHGGFVLRRWLFERAMAVSLDVLGGLYATLYLNPWYRMLGVRLGRGAEVSTASAITPDLLSIGEDAFVADCVSLGAPRVERGTMHLEATRVGPRAFLGNSALVPAGAALARDCLVGCLSAAPRDAMAPPDSSWLGSPPLALPRRQTTTGFPVESTYRPTRALIAQRLAIEALRVILPTTCFVVLTCTLLEAMRWLASVASLEAAVLCFPLLYAMCGAVACAWVVVLKWLVVGRYRRGERPLWSTFVWRNELVTAMHENLADPFVNGLLSGTALAPWFFRALGAAIGRRVYMATTQLTEYDLVSVGDDACLDEDCTLQTHLFEDRVMKMSTVSIGAGASVGTDAIVLYDTRTEPGARVGPLTLVMKGERLPEGTAWEGSPALSAEPAVTRPSARGRP